MTYINRHNIPDAITIFYDNNKQFTFTNYIISIIYGYLYNRHTCQQCKIPIIHEKSIACRSCHKVICYICIEKNTSKEGIIPKNLPCCGDISGSTAIASGLVNLQSNFYVSLLPDKLWATSYRHETVTCPFCEDNRYKYRILDFIFCHLKTVHAHKKDPSHFEFNNKKILLIDHFKHDEFCCEIEKNNTLEFYSKWCFHNVDHNTLTGVINKNVITDCVNILNSQGHIVNQGNLFKIMQKKHVEECSYLNNNKTARLLIKLQETQQDEIYNFHYVDSLTNIHNYKLKDLINFLELNKTSLTSQLDTNKLFSDYNYATKKYAKLILTGFNYKLLHQLINNLDSQGCILMDYSIHINSYMKTYPTDFNELIKLKYILNIENMNILIDTLQNESHNKNCTMLTYACNILINNLSERYGMEISLTDYSSDNYLKSELTNILEFKKLTGDMHLLDLEDKIADFYKKTILLSYIKNNHHRKLQDHKTTAIRTQMFFQFHFISKATTQEKILKDLLQKENLSSLLIAISHGVTRGLTKIAIDQDSVNFITRELAFFLDRSLELHIITNSHNVFKDFSSKDTGFFSELKKIAEFLEHTKDSLNLTYTIKHICNFVHKHQTSVLKQRYLREYTNIWEKTLTKNSSEYGDMNIVHIMKKIIYSLRIIDPVTQSKVPIDSQELMIEFGENIKAKISCDKSVSSTKSFLKLCNLFEGEQLGKGSFGKVFAVKDSHNEILCAMKTTITSSKNTSTWKDLNAFKCLHHENILQPFCVLIEHSKSNHHKIITSANELDKLKSYYDNENYYAIKGIMLEYCPSENLDRHLDSIMTHILPVDTLHSFTLQIAKGLSYIHEQGYVHRDLKTDNVLYYEKTNQLKITDFGISSKINRTAKNHGPKCSIAPEVISEMLAKGFKTATTNEDDWSLGMIMLSMYKLKSFSISEFFPITTTVNKTPINTDDIVTIIKKFSEIPDDIKTIKINTVIDKRENSQPYNNLVEIMVSLTRKDIKKRMSTKTVCSRLVGIDPETLAT